MNVIHLIFILLVSKLILSVTIILDVLPTLNKLSDASLLAVCIFIIVRNWGRINFKKKGILLFFLVIFVQIILFGLVSDWNLVDSLVNYGKFFMPILFVVAIRSNIAYESHTIFWCKIIIGLVTFLALLGTFFLPDMYNHGILLKPTYFSGLHKSSYIVAIALILNSILFYFGAIKKTFMLVNFVVLFWFLVVGWQVRTAIAMVLVIAALLIAQKFGKLKNYVYIAIISVVFWGGSIFLQEVDINDFSSGRIVMWDKKIANIVSAPIDEQLFGQGPTAEKIEVEGWWGAKGSHNDFIKTITIYGIFGLLINMFILYLLYEDLPKSPLINALFVASMLTSFLSNGLMYRPLPNYLFAISLVLAGGLILNNKVKYASSR